MTTPQLPVSPDAVARAWRRSGMGSRPVLSLHVYSRAARTAPVEVPGVEVIGHSYSDAPRALVIGPVQPGFAAEAVTIYGSGLKGVRHVTLHASQEAFEAATQRPRVPMRLAEALRQMDG